MNKVIAALVVAVNAAVAGAGETEDLLRFGYCEDDIGTNTYCFICGGATNVLPYRVFGVEEIYPYTPAETAEVARMTALLPGVKPIMPGMIEKIPDGFVKEFSGPWRTRWGREFVIRGLTAESPVRINVNLTARYHSSIKKHEVYSIRHDEYFKKKEYALKRLKMLRGDYERMLGHYKVHDCTDSFIVEYRRLFFCVAVAWSETEKAFVCETYAADKQGGLCQEPMLADEGKRAIGDGS